MNSAGNTTTTASMIISLEEEHKALITELIHKSVGVQERWLFDEPITEQDFVNTIKSLRANCKTKTEEDRRSLDSLYLSTIVEFLHSYSSQHDRFSFISGVVSLMIEQNLFPLNSVIKSILSHCSTITTEGTRAWFFMCDTLKQYLPALAVQNQSTGILT